MLMIGQAELGVEYHNITTLILFPRTNGIHLRWKLRARSAAKYVTLYNGINSISKLDKDETQLLGKYLVEDIKAIVSLSNIGPFLLVSDDENDIATARLANLTRPRIVLTPIHLDFIRKKINQSGHAQEVFKALIKTLLYAITRDISFAHIAYLALNVNRINYTIYDNSAIKLRFSLSTMVRAQAFDWAYDAFTVEQRRELINDFQYAASIFISYSGRIE
ncbi:unnamed protein product [Rotaria sp. Silwood2]|nr:unnamed protein product [Rotaria sp. Silwood2]